MKNKVKKITQRNVTTIEAVNRNNSWIASIKHKRIRVIVNSVSNLFNRSSDYSEYIANKALERNEIP